MENEFIVSTKGLQDGEFIYVGHAYGQFDPDGNGRMLPYHSMFVLSPLNDNPALNYHAVGMKAEKLRCSGPGVWEGLKPGDRVAIFFDRNGRVRAAALVS